MDMATRISSKLKSEDRSPSRKTRKRSSSHSTRESSPEPNSPPAVSHEIGTIGAFDSSRNRSTSISHGKLKRSGQNETGGHSVGFGDLELEPTESSTTLEASAKLLIQNLRDCKSSTVQIILAGLPHFFDYTQVVGILVDMIADTQNPNSWDLAATMRICNILKHAHTLWSSGPGGEKAILDAIKPIMESELPISQFFTPQSEKSEESLESPRTSFVDLLHGGQKYALLSLNPIELAQQLTILDQKRISHIPIFEFHCTNWTDPLKSPYLTQLACFSNDLVYRFAYEILCSNKSSELLYNNLVKLGTELLELRNFNSLLIVNLTFQFQEVVNAKIYDRQSKQTKSKVDKFRAIFSPLKSFHEYRTLTNGDEPFIPCREILLQDLLFATESQPNYIGDSGSQINRKKLINMGKLICSCLNCPGHVLQEKASIQRELILIERRAVSAIVSRAEVENISEASTFVLHEPERLSGQVMFVGLVENTELNEKIGVVLSCKPALNGPGLSYIVQLPDGESVRAAEHNLIAAPTQSGSSDSDSKGTDKALPGRTSSSGSLANNSRSRSGLSIKLFRS